MHGYRGVEWEQSRGKFKARIEPANGTRGRWLGRYDTAEEAALAYDTAAREVYGEEAYLNFPKAGERKVEASRLVDGICPMGHSLSEHGYNRPDGRGINCRRCNAEARKRSNRKKPPADQSGCEGLVMSKIEEAYNEGYTVARGEAAAEIERLRAALNDSQSLLAAMLLERRPDTEIEDQIMENRRAIKPPAV